MSKQTRNTESRIAALQAEIERLRTTPNPSRQDGGGHNNGKKRKNDRSALVVLAPGFVASTVPGSLYSVLLQSAAQLGQLAAQDAFFSAFKANPSPEMAQKLLNTIGVRHTELERVVHANCQYRQHCSKRTTQLRNRAAHGDRRASGILANPDKSKDGRWVGNLRDAISVLSGARSVAQLNRGRNVRILKKIGLMLDVDHSDGKQRVFLYAQRNHRLFRHARRLLCGHDER